MSKNTERVQIFLNSKKDEGIYTCLCEWEYNNKSYNSRMSFKLQIKGINDEIYNTTHAVICFISVSCGNVFAEPAVRFPLTIQYPINNSVMLTDLGKKLNASLHMFLK